MKKIQLPLKKNKPLKTRQQAGYMDITLAPKHDTLAPKHELIGRA